MGQTTYIISGHMILPRLCGQHSQLLMMPMKWFTQEKQYVTLYACTFQLCLNNCVFILGPRN